MPLTKRAFLLYYVFAHMCKCERRSVMEQVFKVLSDFTRIRIINMISKQKWCVTEMSHILGVSISAVSRHLSKMRMVGILDTEQDAQWVNNIINKNFYNENKLLFDYIENVAQKDETLIGDNKKIQRYIDSGITCRDICDCPNKIIKVLKGE